MKHYIDFHEDVGIKELDYLLDIAADMKDKTKKGIKHHYLEARRSMIRQMFFPA